MDSIIRDVEGVPSRIAEYELQMQQVGEMVVNPPRENLVAAIQEAIQNPRRLQVLEGKVDHLSTEIQKTTEHLWKLEAEPQELLKQVKEATITVQKVDDVVGIPGDTWLKANMFNAELENAGHVFGTKMVTFVMDHGSKMDATLKAMKILIASCMELFPITLESSEDEETSSSYSDLTSQDVVEIWEAVEGIGNQPMEEMDQLEDITALTAPPVFAIKVVVSITTPISSIVGKEILDGCHVAEVAPPSPHLTFHVVARAPSPLAPLASGFLLNS
jgi:hypothetical protein